MGTLCRVTIIYANKYRSGQGCESRNEVLTRVISQWGGLTRLQIFDHTNTGSTDTIMAEDCRCQTNHDRPSHHPHTAPRRHQQVIIHQCCGGQGQEEVVVAEEEEDRPDIPSWVVALYRLITTGDFCKPGKTSQADRRDRQKRIILLQNSATTCD
jgi:hypothetical protein